MTVIVFGSINMDIVVRSPRFPDPGETITGHTSFTAPGGKGANQAVAAAKMGTPTYLIGRVGKDVFATSLIGSLTDYGVNHDYVIIDEQHPSGTALITIDDSAQNEIIIIPGANGAVGFDDITRLKELLQKHVPKNKIILLLQHEVPIEAVFAAIQLASKHDALIILDPAPYQAIPKKIYKLIDIITPNETEAAALVGFKILNIDDAIRAANILRDRGIKDVIIKMGEKGAFWSSATNQKYLPAYKVKAIDTVAAGDAFNGVLAVALHEGMDIESALTWAMAGGALSTMKEGAQPSMPDRKTLLAFLEKQ
jgi:ribokinase